MIGAPFDTGVKLVTKPVTDNGFNPKWSDDSTCSFTIANPFFALLRFVVQEEDAFSEPNFIGQATYPVSIVTLYCYLVDEGLHCGSIGTQISIGANLN